MQDKKMTEEKEKEILKVLEDLVAGQEVPIYALSKKHRLPMIEIYRLIYDNLQQCHLAERLKVVCPYCGNVISEYKTIFEIPTVLTCDKCGCSMGLEKIFKTAYVQFVKEGDAQ